MKMGEREVVTTIEVTKIYRGVPEEFDNDKVQCGENIRKKVEKALDVDNVRVLKVQEIQLQGLRDQMDDVFIDKSVDAEAEKIIEKMKKDDRLISQMDVMEAVQKVLINLGYEPLGEEVNQAFDAIESIGVCTE